MPLYFTGLGSVQAFNSVQVRSRVDGTLMQVPVTEGQEVKEGDILTVVDPRPFQAALDAVLAKRTQDEADLNNAKRDLARYSSLAQSSFASHQQVDTQQAMVNRLTAMIAGDDAAIATAQLNLGYCTITSPFQGRVGLRQVDPGNMVHAGGRDRDHDDHPDPSDLGALHPAAGHPATHQPGDGCREAAGHRLGT